jgi:RNA polymerase sigma-70 factor (ECF subfamily)
MSDRPASGSKRALRTRPSLLIRIRDAQDRRAWEQFVEIYAPLIFGYATRHGLQESDAADLTQEVLGRVHTAIRKFDYDPQKGKFRGWLLTLTQNALKTFLASSARQPRGSGDTGVRRLLENLADPSRPNGDLWKQEYERSLFRWAADRVRVDFRPVT